MWSSGVTPHGVTHEAGGGDPSHPHPYDLTTDENGLVQVAGPHDGQQPAAWALIAAMTLTLAGDVPDALKVSYEAKHSGGICKVRLYKDGNAVGTEHDWGYTINDLTAAYQVFSEDISGLAAGEVLQIWGYGSAGVHHCIVQKFKILGHTGVFTTS